MNTERDARGRFFSLRTSKIHPRLKRAIRREVTKSSGRYAVLICFDGDDARKVAIRYMDAIRTAISRGEKMESPQRFAFPYNAWSCCLALHDCRQHPLQP